MASLPLFPLGTVLMPGAMLPLQIFEPRYVALLHDLLRDQEEQEPLFGVVAIRKGFEVGRDGARSLHPVGCAAVLRQAASLGDRRFLVLSQGTRRFVLGDLVDPTDHPYASAAVTWLPEEQGDPSVVTALAGHLREQVTAYRARIGAEAEDPPEDDQDLSYWMPHALALDVSDRQAVLGSKDTETRLRLGAALLRRERALSLSLGTVARPEHPPLNLN